MYQYQFIISYIDIQLQIVALLRMLRSQCSQQFEAAIGCLPHSHTQVLAEVLASDADLATNQ